MDERALPGPLPLLIMVCININPPKKLGIA
jgi:hypothetical protein